jgi:NAD(P)-dependent dehydrogenase (short-subunit alcohol dehydrogenase family)
VFISLTTGVAHIGPALGLSISSYTASKLAGAQILEFIAEEYPHVKAFNLSPGIVDTDMSRKSGLESHQIPDVAELPAHFAVWLAGPDSDFLKGRFLWANWDVEELLANKANIEADPALFHLTLDGWNDNFAKLK